MGRVFYARNIFADELPAYEALGWTLAGGKAFALDEVSLLVTWDGEGEPVEPKDLISSSIPDPGGN